MYISIHLTIASGTSIALSPDKLPTNYIKSFHKVYFKAHLGIGLAK